MGGDGRSRGTARAILPVDERLDHLETVESTATDESGQRTWLEIELHHRHVPKSTVAGLIPYDAELGQVESRGEATAEPLFADILTP